jgi:hypothetical protein
MNYKVSYTNYIENAIYETMDEADNIEVFDSFTKAKKKLLLVLKMEKTEIEARIKDVRLFTKRNHI